MGATPTPVPAALEWEDVCDRVTGSLLHIQPQPCSINSSHRSKRVAIPSAPPLHSNQGAQLPVVPPLTAICVGAMVPFVSKARGVALRFLAPQFKAALLSAARRRAELSDHVLQALWDEDLTTLDVSRYDSSCGASMSYGHTSNLQGQATHGSSNGSMGTTTAKSSSSDCSGMCSVRNEGSSWGSLSRAVTGSGLSSVLVHAPNLKFLDVTGILITSGTWRMIACGCPHLAVVRLGGSSAINKAALAGLVPLLPCVSLHNTGAKGDGTADRGSWEELAEDTTSVCPPGRLQALQVLAWPGIPAAAAESVAHNCPRVTVNPPNLHLPLDQAYADQLAVPPDLLVPRVVSKACAHEQGAGVEYSIAERFRAAYMEREVHKAQVAVRIDERSERRRRTGNSADKAIDSWLDAV